MEDSIYIPSSCQEAEKHVKFALENGLQSLSKDDFIRCWCSVSFLYPGLHPDGFDSLGSGWKKKLKPIAAEAWRRFEAGELRENEIYCYQAAKARMEMERNAVAQK